MVPLKNRPWVEKGARGGNHIGNHLSTGACCVAPLDVARESFGALRATTTTTTTTASDKSRHQPAARRLPPNPAHVSRSNTRRRSRTALSQSPPRACSSRCRSMVPCTTFWTICEKGEGAAAALRVCRWSGTLQDGLLVGGSGKRAKGFLS